MPITAGEHIRDIQGQSQVYNEEIYGLIDQLAYENPNPVVRGVAKAAFFGGVLALSGSYAVYKELVEAPALKAYDRIAEVANSQIMSGTATGLILEATIDTAKFIKNQIA